MQILAIDDEPNSLHLLTQSILAVAKDAQVPIRQRRSAGRWRTPVMLRFWILSWAV